MKPFDVEGSAGWTRSLRYLGMICTDLGTKGKREEMNEEIVNDKGIGKSLHRDIFQLRPSVVALIGRVQHVSQAIQERLV